VRAVDDGCYGDREANSENFAAASRGRLRDAYYSDVDRPVWLGYGRGVHDQAGEKDHWDCEMLAERMKSELFEPAINMLFMDARGEVARVVFDAAGERRILH
jgi:hypothetical protein